MKSSKSKYMVKIGMLSAIAFILQFLGSIIGFKVGGFLEIELSDLPALIGGFALGPVAGVLVELIKNLLHSFMTTTGFVGEFANFMVNGIFVLTASLIYIKNKTRKRALIGMLTAIVIMTLSATLINLYIMLPMYMPTADFNTKLNLVLTLITPFNFVRGIVLSLLTFFLYKRIRPIL